MSDKMVEIEENYENFKKEYDLFRRLSEKEKTIEKLDKISEIMEKLSDYLENVKYDKNCIMKSGLFEIGNLVVEMIKEMEDKLKRVSRIRDSLYCDLMK